MHLQSKVKVKLVEYVGNLVWMTHGPDGIALIKITQPVLAQKLQDELDLPTGKPPKMPALTGQVLQWYDTGALDALGMTKYHLGTTICMYIMQSSNLNLKFKMPHEAMPAKCLHHGLFMRNH